MGAHPTALIADDEPLLREALARQLAQAWPELEVVAQARNGREAVNLFEAHKPGVCFLDVHMPGLSGMDAASHIGRRAHLVFVTAYDHYAVQACRGGSRLQCIGIALQRGQLLGELLQQRLRVAGHAPLATYSLPLAPSPARGGTPHSQPAGRPRSASCQPPCRERTITTEAQRGLARNQQEQRSCFGVRWHGRRFAIARQKV